MTQTIAKTMSETMSETMKKAGAGPTTGTSARRGRRAQPRPTVNATLASRAVLLGMALALLPGATLLSTAAHAATAAQLCTLTISDLSDAHVKGATVHIDGKLVGQAPMVIQLPAGAHVVALTRPGFAAFQRTVTLRVGLAQVLAPTLVPASTKTQPGPTKARPAPTKAQPAPAKTEPAATKAQPAPTTAQPTPTNAAPTPTKAEPAPAGTKPAPAATSPAPALPAQAAPPAATPSPAATPASPVTRSPGGRTDRRLQLSRGARVVSYGKLVWDLGVGYPHYLHGQGTVGLVDDDLLALDASLWVRSNIAMSEGGLRMRMRLAEGGPFSAVAIGSIGGGGGMGGRDSFSASFGVGGVIVLSERFAVGARAMVAMWSDRLCPEPGTEAAGQGADVCQGDGDVTTAKAIHEPTLTERDTGAALTLSLTLEVALSAGTQLFLVADVAPGQSERPAYSGVFNGALIWARDPGYGGRAGLSFVF